MGKIKANLIILLAAVALVGCSKKTVSPVVDIRPAATSDVAGTTGDVTIINTKTDKSISSFYQADWTSLKCGGSVKVTGAGKSLNSSMQMRMLRNNAVYISICPMLGIEVAKMVFDGDSLLLVDKLHKRYIKEKVNMLTSGLEITVNEFQDILLGRAFEVGKGSLTESIKEDFEVENLDNGNVRLKPRGQFKEFTYAFVYDNDCNILSLEVIPAKSGSTAFSVNYGDVQGSVAGKVAGAVDIATAIKGKSMSLSLNYKDMKWNDKISIDTATPKKYKRVEAGDIMKLLGGE